MLTNGVLASQIQWPASPVPPAPRRQFGARLRGKWGAAGLLNAERYSGFRGLLFNQPIPRIRPLPGHQGGGIRGNRSSAFFSRCSRVRGRPRCRRANPVQTSLSSASGLLGQSPHPNVVEGSVRPLRQRSWWRGGRKVAQSKITTSPMFPRSRLRPCRSQSVRGRSLRGMLGDATAFWRCPRFPGLRF